MGQITVERNVGGIEGLCVITPSLHGDSRGYFMETYSQRDMEENDVNGYEEFVKSIYSQNSQTVIIRILIGFQHRSMEI